MPAMLLTFPTRASGLTPSEVATVAEVIRLPISPISPDSLRPADVAALRALAPSLAGVWSVEVDACDDGDLVACLVPAWADGLASVTVWRVNHRVVVTDMRGASGMGDGRTFGDMPAALEHMASLLGTKPIRMRPTAPARPLADMQPARH